MEPDSPEHNALAEHTPGDDDVERGPITCPGCGAETEANRAAVALKEAYTCPECGEKTTFNNHAGMALVTVVLAVISLPFIRAWLWIRAKIPR